MRCDEIEQALDGDLADFKAAARHIKKCPYCSKIYKDELELEYSLRNLSLQEETIDILPEIQNQLQLKRKRVKTSVIFKQWSWVGAIVFLAGIIFSNLNNIVTAINRSLLQLESLGLSLGESEKGNLTQMAESFKSSDYYSLVLMAVAMFAGVIFYYLWREFKEIIK